MHSENMKSNDMMLMGCMVCYECKQDYSIHFFLENKILTEENLSQCHTVHHKF